MSASPTSPLGSSRRHGRNTSQPVLLRRATKGPLDEIDDPLSASEPATPPVNSPPAMSSPPSEAVSSTISAAEPTPNPPLVRRPKPTVDVRFLQDPAIYHSLPTDDISPIFLKSANQPPPDTPLHDLLQNGHFRRAAIATVPQLVQASHTDSERIFELLYTRLACLVLISRPDLAAQEAVPLTDFLARAPPTAKDVVPLIPWELRLLLVRLQSIGAADGGRRGIMALYSLAAELRSNIAQSTTDSDPAELNRMHARLHDLGLRVADTLVETGELETATRHLASLLDADPDEVAYRQTLLHARVGDLTRARRSLEKMNSSSAKAALTALITLTDGNTADAREEWRALVEKYPDQPLFAQNLVVCILYTGQIADARELLEEVVDKSPSCSGILFNLSTIYELCSERAMEKKTELVQKAAGKTPTADSGGWERPNLDFKL